VELIHPSSRQEVARVLVDAGRRGRRLLIVGGRRHIDKGNPTEVDAELWTTQLDRIVHYEPAEMIAVVEAGVRVGALASILARGGQEWPADAPADATVGGVIGAAVTSPRRLRVGAIRDTVLEVDVVSGDGRFLRGGARTVKNVTGYDLPRLMAGSLGTLGVLVQVAIKVRPLPRAVRTLRASGVDGLEVGRRLVDAVPSAAGVVATADAVELRLEGWAAEVDEQARAATDAGVPLDPIEAADGFPARRPWQSAPVVVEAAVPPSRMPALLEGVVEPWGILSGVGIAWVGLGSPAEQLAALRARAAAFTGVAPVIHGRGGLGADPPAEQVHRRLKASLDPHGVLSPGRFWGGI
jgi:glycolate oxidase FAD binding subunit